MRGLDPTRRHEASVLRQQNERGLYGWPRVRGTGLRVQTLDGDQVAYLNLDHAATTPPFEVVHERVGEILLRYGSIHRGSGWKSQFSTELYEQCATRLLKFLGVTSKRHAVMVTQNTTSSINRLARILGLNGSDTVFLSEFEHSANDLPWRKANQLVRVPATKDGTIDVDRFDEVLRRTTTAGGRRLVAITGASNITGAVTPINEVAQVAHRHGALVVVDAAQLVAHRQIALDPPQRDAEIDFLTFSGHKMYAPYGAGVLVARRDLLDKLPPDDLGGGNVGFVSTTDYELATGASERHAAGTQNIVGLYAMTLAATLLTERIGFAAILRHEQALLDEAHKVLPHIDGLTTYCDLNFDARSKCSIIPFTVGGLPPGLVAARLGHEFGIGVRHGAICQHSYVAQLMNYSASDVAHLRDSYREAAGLPDFGIVRASFGLENTREDVRRLAAAVQAIIKTPSKNQCYESVGHSEWWPIGRERPDVSTWFTVDAHSRAGEHV